MSSFFNLGGAVAFWCMFENHARVEGGIKGLVPFLPFYSSQVFPSQILIRLYIQFSFFEVLPWSREGSR